MTRETPGKPLEGRPKYEFGDFEVDPLQLQLRRRGVGIRIQEQPLRLLLILLERPGELVSRDELRDRIWPVDTFVEFEHSLNVSVSKLRRALNDSAETPQYIETIPRRGYRFIGELRRVESAARRAESQGWKRRLWIVAASLFAASILVGGVVWQRSKSRREAVFEPAPLTSFRGVEATPSFSPDGSQVAFSWNGPEEKDLDIYVKVVGTGEPLRLTSSPLSDEAPAWSPDGRWIAFVRRNGAGDLRGGVLIVSALGGNERKIGETMFDRSFGVPTLAWTPDSEWLAVRDDSGSQGPRGLYLLSIATAERILLLPSGTNIADHGAAFTRDGKRLAFSRNRAIHVVSAEGFAAKGDPKRITSPSGGIDMWPVWTADESDVLFVRRMSMGAASLWRVRADGAEEARRLPNISSQAVFEPALDRSGSRLAFSERQYNVNTWKFSMDAPGRASSNATPVVLSSRYEGTMSLSPDGRFIAFTSTRTGAEQIWRTEHDGSHPVQLTHFSGAMVGMAHWSPDGKSIVHDVFMDGRSQIHVMNADGSASRPISGNDGNHWIPRWSADGKWIYYSSDRGGVRRMWKRAFAGGDEIPVTRDTAMAGGESPDGKYFCYFDDGIWVMPMKNGVPVEAENKKVSEVTSHLRFDISVHGIYFGRSMWGAMGANEILFYNFATGRSSLVFATEKPLAFGLSVSRDERILLFSQADASNGDLVMVERFR
ncbi:MAG: winged helix-turn-helix domain-containing protein [Bryobacteraceae bacterium]